MQNPDLASKPTSITLNDVLYILFKHKVKIVLFALLGIVSAWAIYVLYPKTYASQARLFIRYVEQGKTPLSAEDGARVTTLETRGESIINSELQIITSMDLAHRVAEKIGPGQILGDSARNFDQNAAAKVIQDAIKVSVPSRSTVINIDYTHSNKQLVQPILEELLGGYLTKHLETRSAGSFDSFVNEQAEQYRSRLGRTEAELQNALQRAGVISLEESKADHNSKIAAIQGALLDSEAELALRESVANEIGKLESTTSDPADETKYEPAQGQSVDPGVMRTYASLQARLDVLRRNEQDLLTRYTLENPLVKGAQTQLAEIQEHIEEIENDNPLLGQTVRAKAITRGGGPREAIPDLNSANLQVVALKAKINVLEEQYAQIRRDAERVASVETEIQDLRRRKEIEEQNYRYFSESREQAKIDEAFGAGRVNNIGIVQSPTSAHWDNEATLKLSGGALAICLGIGLAWAFLVELLLDQTIKRPADVKRSLDIPLFLSIPDMNSRAYRSMLKKVGEHKILQRAKRAKDKPSKDSYRPKSPTLIAAAKAKPDRYGPAAATAKQESTEASPWDSEHALHPYFEALRDRLIGFFEGRGLTHKPKLVGLTGIGSQPGTTSVAAGLAGTLSQTEEGNVLLVDMTLGQESAQQFYKGEAVNSLEQLLDTPADTGERQSRKLVVAAEGSNGYKLPKILPNRFNDLVPKLKASDFDYIIFDMPAVSPISVTPRLASFMDAVFIVIESEKASKDVVARATELLQKTNNNIGAILNKTKTYVPKKLQEEYLGDL